MTYSEIVFIGDCNPVNRYAYAFVQSDYMFGKMSPVLDDHTEATFL